LRWQLSCLSATRSKKRLGVSEIATLRVGILRKGGFKVHQHRRMARHVGLGEANIADLEVGFDSAVCSRLEAQVVRFTGPSVLHVKATDLLIAAMKAKPTKHAIA
jgi:4-carboxymuconolactone decarboxylase